MGESIIEATVIEWLKQEGDPVEAGEAVVVLESEKANVEVAAERAGVLLSIKRQVDEDVEVGDVLGLIDERAGAEAAMSSPAAEETPTSEAVPSDGKVTPVARRLAQDRGVDLANVSGSGPGGRVVKEDVERYLAAREQPPSPAPKQPKPAPPTAPAEPAAGRREERVKMSRRRRTIARRLVEAQQTAAMLTTFNEVDMGAVMALRARRKESFVERHGVKLGIASFFVKAVVGALREFPQLNAEIDGDDMVLKHYYDIGMAIGAPGGLVVPVIRDADRLSFAEIERKIKAFAQQAQDNTLALEDLLGGTFTITNGGVFGSLLSTPILNPPQSGILGLHKIEQRPVAVGGEVVVRPMMYLALSYDHRIVDGRESVQFLVRVKELIEDPEVLLLEG
jgi:2-oxoglutarate dehydrogenase E2 component (dihydrolipoamide succinyltransferase)